MRTDVGTRFFSEPDVTASTWQDTQLKATWPPAERAHAAAGTEGATLDVGTRPLLQHDSSELGRPETSGRNAPLNCTLPGHNERESLYLFLPSPVRSGPLALRKQPPYTTGLRAYRTFFAFLKSLSTFSTAAVFWANFRTSGHGAQ